MIDINIIIIVMINVVIIVINIVTIILKIIFLIIVGEYDDCDRQPLPRHADHSDHDEWMMMIRMPKIFDCACGAADKDEGNADGNADADDDHLYQETGGRAPRQLCCIAVTVYIAISKHCHIKVLPYQSALP